MPLTKPFQKCPKVRIRAPRFGFGQLFVVQNSPMCQGLKWTAWSGKVHLKKNNELIGTMVGGFNPSEKYARQNGNLPQVSG